MARERTGNEVHRIKDRGYSPLSEREVHHLFYLKAYFNWANVSDATLLALQSARSQPDSDAHAQIAAEAPVLAAMAMIKLRGEPDTLPNDEIVRCDTCFQHPYPAFSMAQRKSQSAGETKTKLACWRKEFPTFPSTLPLLPFSMTPLREGEATKNADDTIIGKACATRIERARSLPLERIKEAQYKVGQEFKYCRLLFDVLLEELKPLRSTNAALLFQAFMDYYYLLGVDRLRKSGYYVVRGEFVRGDTAYDIVLDIANTVDRDTLVQFTVPKLLHSVQDIPVLSRTFLRMLDGFTKGDLFLR
ncbi:hypothetical protein GQ53DRAFT_765448 [Thozetella sp. PMI_491]|nr:hypothetical protein GQ53DRAFT_765448 [Thozetella sp. PMI_491]